MKKREIKFRAWNKIEKKMMVSAQYFWELWGLLDFIRFCLDRRESKYSTENDFILLQFTGLKDKNGKEIYESDLIFYAGKIWEVRWVCAGFWLVIPEEPKDIEMTPTELRFMEVIGNIYEHPNLLKQNGDRFFKTRKTK